MHLFAVHLLWKGIAAKGSSAVKSTFMFVPSLRKLVNAQTPIVDYRTSHEELLQVVRAQQASYDQALGLALLTGMNNVNFKQTATTNALPIGRSLIYPHLATATAVIATT